MPPEGPELEVSEHLDPSTTIAIGTRSAAEKSCAAHGEDSARRRHSFDVEVA